MDKLREEDPEARRHKERLTRYFNEWQVKTGVPSQLLIEIDTDNFGYFKV